MPNESLKQSKEWLDLQTHYADIKDVRVQDLFDTDSKRFDKFHIRLGGLLFDYSKHNITGETQSLLLALAKACAVEGWRDKMFSGEKINTSEDRAVLHMALRGSTEETLEIDGENVAGFTEENLKRIKKCSEKIRTDPSIKTVVSLGIGGSNLGPQMVCEALKPFMDGPETLFVSNIDGAHIEKVLKNKDPHTTLFIVSSKTFSTQETLTNARTALAWLCAHMDGKEALSRIWAVTCDMDRAQKFGVSPDHIFPLREWIGGRYSLWSAVGLPIAIATGFESFKQLLKGAHDVDVHFKTAPLERNIPAMMALLGIWHRNFANRAAHAILPYAQDLHRLPAYIQQLDMESNGKSVDRDGKRVDYATGPIIFGEPGTDAQHAFFQLLHQGTDIIPADFILAARPEHGFESHHRQLLASALAQTQALMQGSHNPEEPHRRFEGNRPVSTLILERLDSYHLGMLLALYEHKIFVQGLIWNLNSFDQWGVELGKTLTNDLLKLFESRSESATLDPSTRQLAEFVLKPFIKS